MIKPYKHTAARLKWFRETNELSKSQIARKIRLSPQFYGRAESGTKLLSPQKLKLLAKLYKVNSTVFLHPLALDHEIQLIRAL